MTLRRGPIRWPAPFADSFNHIGHVNHIGVLAGRSGRNRGEGRNPRRPLQAAPLADAVQRIAPTENLALADQYRPPECVWGYGSRCTSTSRRLAKSAINRSFTRCPMRWPSSTDIR